MGGCFSAFSKNDEWRTKVEEEYVEEEIVSDSDTEYKNNNSNEAESEDTDSEISSVSSFHNKLPQNVNTDYMNKYWDPVVNQWIIKHGPQREDSDFDVSSVSSHHFEKPQDFKTDYKNWYLDDEVQSIGLKQVDNDS